MKASFNRHRMWVTTRNGQRPPLLEKLIERPAAVMSRGRVLKHDQTTTVTVVEDAGDKWVVKRYNTKNRWHAVRRLFRTSRALNCWRATAWLETAGIDTARPVAAMEERPWKFLRGRSYFVCEFIEGKTLDRVLAKRDGNNDRFMELACRIVHGLRDHGIIHGDLKSTNFIVSGDRISLVDLDATQRASGPRLAAGVEKDRHRFLRNWVDHPQLLKQFEKHLLPGDGST